jgi:hypothetical protein
MDLLSYLDTPERKTYQSGDEDLYSSITLLNKDIIYSIDLHEVDIAFLGFPFSEDNQRDSCFADAVRSELANLAQIKEGLSILDLGNIKKGNSLKDSLVALKDVLNFLKGYNVFVIIISNCNHVKKAFLESTITTSNPNLVEIDPKFAIIETLDYIADDCQNNINYTNIGYQSYYTFQSELNWLKDNHYSAYRLGEVRADLSEIEPAIRNSSAINISLNALKCQEAPGQAEVSPNGFYSEEICQLAKYSGAADYLEIADISGFKEDAGLQTIRLTAQIMWFLIFGYTIRVTEDPRKDPHIKKFNVGQKVRGDNLIFYKSDKTDRWWVEITINEDKENVILPANYKDYIDACNQQIPDRWLKAMQKHNFKSHL